MRALAYYAEHKHDPKLRERVARATKAHYGRVKADPDALAARRAATARWRIANPEATTEQYRRWRIKNSDAVRAKVQRRRARLLEAFVEDVDPAAIWLRDGGTCGICCQPIDPLLPWPHRMSKTLDHVIPLAKGGTHEPANVQLAHAVCNSRKNDRLEDVAVDPEQAS